MIVENICCQGSVPGYEFYFRSNVLIIVLSIAKRQKKSKRQFIPNL